MVEHAHRGGDESAVACNQGSPPGVAAPGDLAIAAAHRLETRQLLTRMERMAALLEEHGIPLPSEDRALGASSLEHAAATRAVVLTAYDLLASMDAFDHALGRLREIVGSGTEMLQPPWKGGTE